MNDHQDDDDADDNEGDDEGDGEDEQPPKQTKIGPGHQTSVREANSNPIPFIVTMMISVMVTILMNKVNKVNKV